MGGAAPHRRLPARRARHARPAADPREAVRARARDRDPARRLRPRRRRAATPELVLVSGYSGIGKSSVVNELHKVLVPPRGLFASGKFDQYKRDIPYATLAQAFQSLVRPLLGKSEAELARWRDALLEALGPNGQLMVDLVPELKLIIGEQPPVPELPPQDAQRRFQLVFRRFIGVFARAGASAGAVPRRSAMARRGDARSARGPADPAGRAAPAADRRLPGQRGRSRASADAHARRDPRAPARRCRRSVLRRSPARISGS